MYLMKNHTKQQIKTNFIVIMQIKIYNTNNNKFYCPLKRVILLYHILRDGLSLCDFKL